MFVLFIVFVLDFAVAFGLIGLLELFIFVALLFILVLVSGFGFDCLVLICGRLALGLIVFRLVNFGCLLIWFVTCFVF